MMRKMHKHFYTSSGMFLLVAGAVGLSGVMWGDEMVLCMSGELAQILGLTPTNIKISTWGLITVETSWGYYLWRIIPDNN